MAKELTEKVIEETADAIEMIADEVDSVAGAVRDLNQIKLYAGLVGAAGGVVVGSIITLTVVRKRLEVKYAKIADDEIAMMRDHFDKKESARLAEEAKAEYISEVEVVEPAVDSNGSPLRVVKNVFEEHADGVSDWNYAAEVKNRNPDRPYIIHKDEFDANEGELQQTTITYFAGDDVLADERDSILDQKDALVGEDNLLRFGHGSDDPNVVFIRNESLSMEWEIVRSEGSYAKEVHGLDASDELTHSDMRRHRPRRDFDDDPIS